MPSPSGDAPLILFAHGAGAPSSSRWMAAWAKRLAALGVVVPFDYPYMAAGRKTPDKLPVLIDAHRAALDTARKQHGTSRPVILAGKSMGGRVGCHVAVALAAAAPSPVAAVICFGYPLRAAGTGTLRDEVLRALTTPVLFLQGSRDPLCPLADLASVREKLAVDNDLFVVEGGDHSLEIRKRAAGTPGQAEVDDAIFAAIGKFLAARV